VDAAPERLEEGRHRPELRPVEPDRRLVDARHDVRVPLDEVGARIEERLDQVLLGGEAGLSLGGAGADPGQVGSARALLADLVADLAGPLRVEDLLARLHELRRRDVATLQGQLLRGLGLDLGDRVGEVRVHAHHDQREDAELETDGNTHRYRGSSLPPAITGIAAAPCAPALPFSERPPSQKMNITSAKKTMVTVVIMLAAEPSAGVTASTDVSRRVP